MKYIKKPMVIEAFQFGIDEPWTDLPFWFRDKVTSNEIIPDPDGGCFIDTLEGRMKANIGDFIIKGIKGEIYPCKEDIFKESYMPLDMVKNND